MADISAFMEWMRPWISTGALVGLLTLASRLWVVNRKMRLAETRDDREGYGVLIKALQDDVASVRAEHRRCEERLAKIEGELLGFHRQALLQSQQGVAQLPASAMVQDAAVRSVAAASEALGRKKAETGQ